MKKSLLIVAVLFLFLAPAVFADRDGIEEALDAYEAITVEAENLAEMHLVDIGDFNVLDEKATAAEAAIQAVAQEREWFIRDAKRSAELRIRFNAAMATVIEKLLQY